MKLISTVYSLLFVIFTTFLFGQFGRLNIVSSNASFYIYEAFMAALLLYFFIQNGFLVIKNFFNSYKSFYYLLLYFFIVYIVFIYKFTFEENLIALLYFVRLVFYAVFFIYLNIYLKNNKVLLKIYYFYLNLLTYSVILLSFLQYIFFFNLRPLMFLGWDPHLYRMFGTFLEPAFAAAIYAILFLNILFSKMHGFWLRKILLFLLGICIFLTLSRAAILSFLAVLVLYWAINIKLFNIKVSGKHYILHAFLTVLVCGAFLFFINLNKSGEGVNLLRTSTVRSRIENYREGFIMFKESPILGVGYNRIAALKDDLDIPLRSKYSVNMSRSSFHSSFLIVLVTGGLIGLILFSMNLYILAKKSTFNLVLIVFLSIFALFDNILLHPFVIFITFACILHSYYFD